MELGLSGAAASSTKASRPGAGAASDGADMLTAVLPGAAKRQKQDKNKAKKCPHMKNNLVGVSYEFTKTW